VTEIVPLEKFHMEKLVHEDMNLMYIEQLYNEHLFTHPLSRAVLIDGEVMVVGGALEQWQGRAMLWMIFSEKSKMKFVTVFRAMKDLLKFYLNEFQRLETYMPADFYQAHRRAQLFGFSCEVRRSRKFFPSGQDGSIYSICRGDL